MVLVRGPRQGPGTCKGRVQTYTCVLVIILLTSEGRGPWATGFTVVEKEEGLAASGCCFSGPGTYMGER